MAFDVQVKRFLPRLQRQRLANVFKILCSAGFNRRHCPDPLLQPSHHQQLSLPGQARRSSYRPLAARGGRSSAHQLGGVLVRSNSDAQS